MIKYLFLLSAMTASLFCRAQSVGARAAAPTPSPVQTNPQVKIRTGKHNITLQWIDFNSTAPGTVTIEKLPGNLYKIEGGQQSKINADYLKISGVLTPVSSKEVVFDGKLIYSVHENNSGSPCDKSGRHIFLSTKNRKYWRMQEMTNCDGIVTDYVDLFF